MFLVSQASVHTKKQETEARGIMFLAEKKLVSLFLFLLPQETEVWTML